MDKLLKAEFYRLKKDKVFLIFIIITIALALFTLYKYFDGLRELIALDRIITEYLYMYFGIFIAFFVSIIVGKEYTEGFIRNKIITGHKRTSIYLANLILCVVAGIIANLVYTTIVFFIGTKLFGTLQILSLQKIITYSSLIIIVYCTIYNLITMLCKDSSVSLVTCIIVYIIMFVVMMFISTKLMEKPFTKITKYNMQGDIEFYSEDVNPNYPGETAMNIYKVINYLLPTGQASVLQNACTEILDFDEEQINERNQYLSQMPIYAIFEIVFLNIVGIFLFERQELK